jgi:hypothetical protein
MYAQKLAVADSEDDSSVKIAGRPWLKMSSAVAVFRRPADSNITA